MRRWLDRFSRPPEGAWLAGLALLAIAVRLAWAAAATPRQPLFDEVSYIGYAARLCAGLGYVNLAGIADDFWPVGFPALLAAVSCGRHTEAMIGLQIALGTVTCVLVSAIGERVFGRSTGRLAGLTAALYPTHVMYSTLMVTEPLATMLLVSAVGLLMRSLRTGGVAAAAAGAVLAMAILTRPVLTLVPALTVVWYVLSRVELRRALLLGGLVTVLAIAGLSPWIIRNHRVLGAPAISGNAGYVFFLGNAPGALGSYGTPNRGELFHDGRFDSSLGYRRGWANIRRDPLGALRRIPQKLSYFVALETDGVLWNMKGLDVRPPPAATIALLVVANAAYFFVVGGALLALTGPQPRTPFATLFLLLSIYLVAMTAVFMGDPRYHFVLMPLAAILCARALIVDGPALRSGVRHRDPIALRWRRRFLLVSAVFSSLMLLNLWLKYLEIARPA